MKHWCIVMYIGNTPFFYAGYFAEGKPAFVSDFESALKITEKQGADLLRRRVDPDAILEEHETVNNQLSLF